MHNLPEAACLYVVATPIGNMGDMSQRAVAVLAEVDLIYAEDSRQTHKLLQHFAIKNSIYQLHRHNEAAQKHDVAKQLDNGKSVAIVSDAGTPLIADPGYAVLAYLREHGYSVYAIPGCSAVIAALSVSGLPTDNFQFVGFVPGKAKQRQDFLANLLYCRQTTVFFEAPHRIKDCLADCLSVLGGERKIFIGRELTKQFDDSVLLPLAAAEAWLVAHDKRQKGEFVLVLEASTSPANSDWQQLAQLMAAEKLPTKIISKVVSAYCQQPKKQVYQYVLSMHEAD